MKLSSLWHRLIKLILIFFILLLAGVNLLPNNLASAVATTAENFLFKGHIFDKYSLQPLANVNLYIDSDINSDFSSDTVKKTITGGDGFFEISLPSQDYNQAYIVYDGNDGREYRDLRTFISWEADVLEVNVSLEPGFGLEYAHFLPIYRGWNLVATPLQPKEPKVENFFTSFAVVGETAQLVKLEVDARVFSWDNLSQGLQSYSIWGDANFDSIAPGRGYWYRSEVETALVIRGSQIRQAGEAEQMDFSGTGWGLIGNPWGDDYNLGDVYVANEGVEKKFSEAVREGWIAGLLYAWNGVSQELEEIGTDEFTTQILPSGRGFWVQLSKPSLNFIWPSPHRTSVLNQIELPIQVRPDDLDIISRMDFNNLTADDDAFIDSVFAEINIARDEFYHNNFNGYPDDSGAIYTSAGKPLLPSEVLLPEEYNFTTDPADLVGSSNTEKATALGSINSGYPPAEPGPNNILINFVPRNTPGEAPWTEAEKTNFLNYRRSETFKNLLRKIMQFNGPPLVTPQEKETRRINVLVWKKPSMAGEGRSPHMYDVAGGIRNIYASDVGAISNINTTDGQNFIEEVAHMMRGFRALRDGRIEESLANAVIDMAFAALDIDRVVEDLLYWYEQRNREVISPRAATASIMWEGDPLISDADRYALGSAAFRKVYLEDNEAFKRFNRILAAVFTPLIAPNGTTQFKKAVKQAERQTIDQWLDRQYGLGFHELDDTSGSGYWLPLYFPPPLGASRRDYAYVSFGISPASGNIAYYLTDIVGFAPLSKKNNQFRLADGYFDILGYKTTTVEGQSKTLYFSTISRRGLNGNTSLVNFKPDPIVNRYTRYVWQTFVKELDAPFLNMSNRRKPPYSANVAYSGVPRPFLWGIVDHGHTGRVFVRPISPQTGAPLKPYKEVTFRNGVFDADDPDYGQGAGTYEIEFYKSLCSLPIRRIVTKPEGEYYVFIETQGRAYDYLPIKTAGNSSVLTDLTLKMNSWLGESQTEEGCELTPTPEIDNITKEINGEKLVVAFDTTAATGGYLQYVKDDGSDETREFNELTEHQEFALNNLTDGRTYPYQIAALTDLDEVDLQEDDTFTFFQINNPGININSGSTTVSWDTSVETVGQVEYGATQDYGQTTAINTAFSKTHSVTISGLTNGQSYHFRIKAYAQDNTIAKSNDLVTGIYPQDMAIVGSNAYFSYRNRIYKLDLSTKTISLFAGSGQSGYNGLEPANPLETKITQVKGLQTNQSGNVYFIDRINAANATPEHREGEAIRKISADGTAITRVVGGGPYGWNQSATNSNFAWISHLTIDPNGLIAFRADGIGEVALVESDGTWSRLSEPFSSGPSSCYDQWGNPTLLDIEFDNQGLLGAACGNNRISYDTNVSYWTLRLDQWELYYAPPITSRDYYYPFIFDPDNNVIGRDSSRFALWKSTRIRFGTGDTPPSPIRIVGSGSVGYSGDGGPATEAKLGEISDFAYDNSGNLYINTSQSGANKKIIRKVDTTGIISTFYTFN